MTVCSLIFENSVNAQPIDAKYKIEFTYPQGLESGQTDLVSIAKYHGPARFDRTFFNEELDAKGDKNAVIDLPPLEVNTPSAIRYVTPNQRHSAQEGM